MTKYSIVLRAYNAGVFLHKSVESVQKQSYSNWELIIVDDGSTDDTGIIADRFAREDSRIIVIHQENRGCVLATQAGIAVATGAYIAILDADDWYEADYLEKVDAAVQRFDPDMVLFNYNVVNDSEIIERVQLTDCEGFIDCQEVIKRVLQTTNAALFNKVVKREKVQYSNEYMRFLEEMGKTSNFGEDLYQLMPVLCSCTRIYQLKDHLYNYYVNEDSITHQRMQTSWEILYQRIRLMETTFHTIQQKGFLTEEISGLIQRNCVWFSLPIIVQLVKERRLDRENLFRLKANVFYKNVVACIPHAKMKELTNLKRIIVFRIFNLFMTWAAK